MSDASATTEETISVASSAISFNYTYSFENVTDYLDDELCSLAKDHTNFNKKYGIPTVTELHGFTATNDCFFSWLMDEYPSIVKIPKVCPVCASPKLKINQGNVRCYTCARNGKEFKKSVWNESFF